MGRLVGIDYGLKRIGVALTDPTRTIASPYKTVLTARRPKETVTRLLHALSELEIDSFVVGMPYRLNGSMGVMADEIAFFSDLLREQHPADVVTWDERLTTLQAERSLKEGGLSRKRRAPLVDKISATILLQSYLEVQGSPS